MFSGSGLSGGGSGDVRGSTEGADGGDARFVPPPYSPGSYSPEQFVLYDTMFSGRGLSGGGSGDVRGSTEGADGGDARFVLPPYSPESYSSGSHSPGSYSAGHFVLYDTMFSGRGLSGGAGSDIRGAAEGADGGVRGGSREEVEGALRSRLTAEMERSYSMGVELAECMTDAANLATSVSFHRWQTECFRESLLDARAALRQKEVVIRGLKAEKRLRKDLARKEFARGFWKAVRLVHRRIGVDLSRITEDDVSDDGEL